MQVMSCLLQISNSAIALNEILTEDQLLKLLQMAVWCENGKSMCGGKWTSHAITCMLQDIMDSKKICRIFPMSPHPLYHVGIELNIYLTNCL